ncbi:patatin-like phospholipase family protein, partial [Rhizobium hidalgonense]
MHTKPFNRLLMFSGGGSRFGYYLGAYAALVDHQLIPDIILASCGGSLAAALVDIAPESDQLKQLATSKTLHTMLQR